MAPATSYEAQNVASTALYILWFRGSSSSSSSKSSYPVAGGKCGSSGDKRFIVALEFDKSGANREMHENV